MEILSLNKLTLISTTACVTCLVLTSCATPEQKAARETARQVAITQAISASEEKIPDGFSRLTGDALLEFVSDSSVSGLSEKSPGWSYEVYRAPDGTQRGTSKKGGDTSTDTGEWTIKGDMYCSQWNRWADGKKSCYRLYTGATKEYYSITAEGKLWSSKEFQASREKGNTKSL